MKNILYISYDGLTDPLGQSQILPYLKELSRHGYTFTILSFEKKTRFEKEGKLVQELVNKANIKWVPLSFTSSPPVLSKIYDRFRMWQTAIKLHQQHSFAMVHCRSYLAAEAGLKLKKKFGLPLLFDMRGFWADEKVDNGQWDISQPFYKRIYKHYKQKEKEFLLNADGIISLTEAAKEYLHKQLLYKDLVIDVIPCCADLAHFDFNKIKSSDVNELKLSLSVPADAKVITYLGSVGGWYMTKEMFQFFKALYTFYPSYVLLILTKDDNKKVKEEAMDAGIPAHKIIVTYSDRQRLPVFLALSNLSFFFIRNTFSKTASSPTKHAELMGMGIPVICNDIGDTGKIIEATETGIILNEFEQTSMQQAVAKVAGLEKIGKEKIRATAAMYFDLATGAQRYLNVYNRILAN